MAKTETAQKQESVISAILTNGMASFNKIGAMGADGSKGFASTLNIKRNRKSTIT